MASPPEVDTLPAAYRIMSSSIELRIPGFEAHYRVGDRTLVPSDRSASDRFSLFMEHLTDAMGTDFLPICRMSDGEFRFLLGDQPPDIRRPIHRRAVIRLKRLLHGIGRRGAFRARTARSVSSGFYTKEEWREARGRYTRMLRAISEQGFLALHLTYTSDSLFQQHYFPALKNWLDTNEIQITDDNYVPFYFVYAALLGPRKSELLSGRRILVVNSSQGEKRRRIEDRLRAEGAAAVVWCEISPARSFYDEVNTDEFAGRADVAIVGAGVGKPNILMQLAPLNIPCIDAGYVFEVWADEDKKWQRPYCVPDDEWDPERITFVAGGAEGGIAE